MSCLSIYLNTLLWVYSVTNTDTLALNTRICVNALFPGEIKYAKKVSSFSILFILYAKCGVKWKRMSVATIHEWTTWRWRVDGVETEILNKLNCNSDCKQSEVKHT